jgi:glutaredoxin-like YruB-family protein
MRNAWLTGLVLFCVLASGFVLVQGRSGDEPADLGSLADEMRAEVEEAAAELRGDAAAGGERSPASFYRYTDETGTVRFVTSLAEVPKHLRASARPVSNDRVQRAPSQPPAKRARVQRAEPTFERAAPREVVVYTTSWCGWCRKTLAFLTEEGVDFENRDIEADDAWREELLEKTGSTSIPVVEIDGKIIRGYDPKRMAQLLRSS